ncbi:MAG: glycosyltransferase [Caldiserica bacterium]|nr:glycosyltransferase [Caldisericota bacterium]
MDFESAEINLHIPSNYKLYPRAPYPLNYPFRFIEGVSPERFLIAYLGAPAKQKNFQKLYEVIASAPEDFGFIVQCNTPPGLKDPKILDLIKSLKEKRGEKVILLESSLPKESYFSALKQSSIVWCLYDPNWYRGCISAILLEAWLLGKPVITTRGTWMAKQVEKFGGGLVFENLDTQEILRGIERIRADYARFSAEAQAAGRILYEKNNGLALARFIKEVISK